MRDFAAQFKPIAFRQLDAKGQLLSNAGLAGGIDEAAYLREIGDARGTASMSVPNGIERNIQTLLAAALVHIQFWDLGTVPV